MKHNFIELFAGAGGLSEGFIEHGFNPIAFIERDNYCCDTLRTRQVYLELKRNKKINIYHKYLLKVISKEELYSHVQDMPFNNIVQQEINKNTINLLITKMKAKLQGEPLALILGGPPCQAYSLIGRVQNKRNENDERLYLYKYYLQFLKELKPDAFIFENVPGLLSINEGDLFRSIIRDFETLGYKVDYKILNAKDYGVLQERKRLIVVGNLSQKIDIETLDTNRNDFNVEAIFSDLKPLAPSETKNEYHVQANEYLKMNKIRDEQDILTLHQARPHNERDLEIYRFAIDLWNKNKQRIKYSDLPSKLKTHKNEKSFLDRFKVVCADLPASHTMVAHIAKDGHHYIHPDINQCRSISVREAARIQAFPDNFFFEGPRTAQFTQIGNAVPPLLSKALAKMINKYYGT